MLGLKELWRRFKCKFCCASKCEILNNIDDIDELKNKI